MSNQSAKRYKCEVESSGTSEFLEDEDGLLICNPGEIIGPYKFEEEIGYGGFARVMRATVLETGATVALKMMKNARVAMAEVAALKRIQNIDGYKDSLCINMLDFAIKQNFSYIAFPLLGFSVLDFLLYNSDVPFPIDQVKHIAYQVCHAVNFLHTNGMTHTDLKLDNIIFVNSSYESTFDEQRNCEIRRIINTDIRLIDFALVTRDAEFHKPVACAKLYRPPEVILRLGWSQPCDVWSIGCMLLEMYTGKVLFDGDNDRKRLALMEKTLGPIPKAMANSTKTDHFVNGKLDWSWEGQSELEQLCRPLHEWKLQNSEADQLLFDLSAKMLKYEPTNRIVLRDALRHDFFKVENK